MFECNDFFSAANCASADRRPPAIPNPFGVLAFLKFVTFGVFGMSMIMLSWRARQQGAASRSDLAQLYCRVYAGMACGGLAVWLLGGVPLALVLLLFSFWLPQSVHSAISGHLETPFPARFVVLVSVTRLFEPLYAFGCPHNLLGIDATPAVLLLPLWVAAQAALLLLQRYKGARALTPAAMWPDRYDYFRAPEKSTETMSSSSPPPPPPSVVTCSVCLSEVDPTDRPSECRRKGDETTTTAQKKSIYCAHAKTSDDALSTCVSQRMSVALDGATKYARAGALSVSHAAPLASGVSGVSAATARTVISDRDLGQESSACRRLSALVRCSRSPQWRARQTECDQ